MKLRISTNTAPFPYPKPQQKGGGLIRQCVRTLREAGVSLPLNGPVWIAVSGGADSVALARVMTQYGRRIASREQIRFLHIHHGWRPRAAQQDQKFVEKLAKDWGIPLECVRLSPGYLKKGESWEDSARQKRLQIFQERLQSGEDGGVILTAHHGDDLAETLLWRICTGTFEHEKEGIRVSSNGQLRPFLSVRKKDLIAFLKEEGLSWREDFTNTQSRFLRAKIRKKIMPVLEEIFPQAVPHLIRMGLSAQSSSKLNPAQRQPASRAVLGKILPILTQTRLKPQHYQALLGELADEKEIHLPEGWVVRCEKKQKQGHIRWILEQSGLELNE